MSRYISLLPSLTEGLCALGLGADIVGITHECDYPPEILDRAVVTTTTLAHDLTSFAIETEVLAQIQAEPSLYGLNRSLLAQLQPDCIFTQKLCDVCAVSETLVQRVAQELHPTPQVVSVGPINLEEILQSMILLGHVTGRAEAAHHWLSQARTRIQNVQERVAGRPRPRVFALEWLDPPYVSGHWMPELIALAGGIPWGEAGTPSVRLTWEQIAQFDPHVMVILPCGFSIARTLQEVAILATQPLWSTLTAVQKGRVSVADGNSYFNRPGPRILESLELLAALIHPEVCQDLAPSGGSVPYPL